MKEKIVKEIIEHLYENISKDEQKMFDEMKVAEKFKAYVDREVRDLDEEESVYILNKLKLSIEQADLGYDDDDINYKYIDMFSNVNNYIISIDDSNKMYTLEELFSKCSLKQLNLYNMFYNYSYSIYNVEKSKDRYQLINTLKKDVIFSFKRYIRIAKNKEIILFKSVLKNNGIIDNVDEELVQLGYFIPFKLCTHKKRKYVMAKELLDIIKNYDFSVTSEGTKESVSTLLEIFVASKGIVSQHEVDKFIMDVVGMNIKKEELFEIVSKKFLKKDAYYIEQNVDNNIFNKLVKIKKENPYMPSYEEIVELQFMLNELYTLLAGIAGKEVKMSKVVKDLFYKPMEINVLVNKLCKKLKISEKDEDLLEEFMYEYFFDFPYWIYNGEHYDTDGDFFDFDGLGIDDNFVLTDEDLPF